ncbi:MAG TPA: DUF881 domain-containing protein [Propionibacteriaceae bacterium]|nr:DUF881 domain-containing protein [Propionibacteriaceae bacterium]
MDEARPAAQPAGRTSEAADAARSTRARLRASLLHPGRGQILAAIILFIVGVAGAMQIHVNTADDAYASARREDLIQLLDGLSAESRRLEGEIAQLEQTRSNLQSGADTQRVARSEAERHLTELSILAGTSPAAGQGIRMRIADPKAAVDARVLLDAVEEMRDAGAEVIEVNNTIRVVGSTWFGSDARGLLIDGKLVSRPITLEVIGEPHSLEEAARFRGGIVSEITGPRIGGQVQIEQEDRVVIESLHTSRENQYARPAPSPSTPR